ncbi:SusC/RagA family TonB-linked outer membrane protein [Myroides sp. LJL116]
MKSNFTPIYGYGIAMALLSFCFSPSLLHANTISTRIEQEQQKVTITGTIKDFNGALPGVVVQVKNKNTATITDVDGKYSIQASPSEALVFSYIGYSGQEITINQKRIIDLELQQNSQELEEVIVNAGYYSVKDKERTGSIARVTAKDIELQPVINPLQALQGRMAGVNITQATGAPGGAMRVEIRGRNFLGISPAQNSPLYIINGIPIISDNLGSQTSNNINSMVLPGNISPLNNINPSDIENIEVLKDADATAIYGSRGANGVILITTKKGKQGDNKFTITSSLGYSKVANYMDMMGTEDYLRMRKEAFSNSGVNTYGPKDYDINGTWDQTRYTNWQKELIGNTAVNKTISLGVTGGSELSNYNINLSHNESTTVFPTDKGYKRNSALINFNQRTRNNKLLISSSINYSQQNNNLPATDLTKNALQLSPNSPSLYTSEGEINWENGTFANPIASLGKTYENEINSFILNSSLSYAFSSLVSFKIDTGINSLNYNEIQLTPHTIHNPTLNTTSENSNINKNINSSYSYIIEPQLNFNKTWNKHTFNLLTGITYQSSLQNFLGITGSNFSSNSLITNIGAAKNREIIGNSTTQYNYLAYFSRLNYIYNHKYIINITARRDGSSRFSPDNRFGNFGALGAAWILTKEDFTQNWKWLSFAKLRGSYGITGSDNIGDYAYLDAYSTNTGQYANSSALKPIALYNPDYRWEKTTKLETALELSFFKDRLNSSIAYYDNRSGNQLIGYTLPSTTGFDKITSNFPAVVRNYGWEFTFNSSNIISTNFKWTTNFNIAFNRNKLVSYPGLEDGTQSSLFIIGKPLNIYKSYNYQGLNNLTGQYQFEDYDTDGKFTTFDKKIINDLNPKFTGGLHNTISYKKISLDFLFQFVKKKSYNYDYSYYNAPGAAMINQPTSFNNRWSQTNPSSKYTQAMHWSDPNYSQASLYRNSNEVLTDSSYIRLKNISINYECSLKKLKIDQLRLFIQGQNLWTITNYYGLDPEFISPSFLPPLKTLSFGLQLTF